MGLATTAATAIVVIDEQENNDDEEDPGAIIATKQISQAHISLPPFPSRLPKPLGLITLYTMWETGKWLPTLLSASQRIYRSEKSGENRRE